ncbi:MAG: anthranilate phosphoribosyltransferase [Acidimicrobiales bacterium]
MTSPPSSARASLDAASFSALVLAPLVRHRDLDRETARQALAAILRGEVEAIHIAAFLTALTAKGETPEEMTGFVDAMVAAATTFELEAEALDIVGTGGDQLHTVNVSTMAALAVAGAGVPVAKHGNRAASSSVGAADVLEGLGVRLDVAPPTIRRCVREAGMGFIFAPVYHHALGYLTPIRRTLNFRTIFNVLGPLANPAGVTRLVVGVAHRDNLEPMAEVLRSRGITKAILVCAGDGMDELTLGSVSDIATVDGAGVRLDRLDAGGVLGRHHSVDEVRGGDIAHNVGVVERFLGGAEDAVSDVVLANAALALLAADRVTSLPEGFELARDSVVSGRAATVLSRLVELSNAAS